MNKIKYYYRFRLDGLFSFIFVIIILSIILYLIFNVSLFSNDFFIKMILKDSNSYIKVGKSKPEVLDLIRSVELPFYNVDKVFDYYEGGNNEI